jgi:hypothetical protein
MQRRRVPVGKRSGQAFDKVQRIGIRRVHAAEMRIADGIGQQDD